MAGIYNDLYGCFLYMDLPHVSVWAGTAYYRLHHLLPAVRIPEGGTIRLEETGDGTRMSHAIWMDFPNSPLGRALYRGFENVLDGPRKLADHNERELRLFKGEIESGSRKGSTARRLGRRLIRRRPPARSR